MMVASNLVEPSSIQVSWDDIGSDFVFETLILSILSNFLSREKRTQKKVLKAKQF